MRLDQGRLVVIAAAGFGFGISLWMVTVGHGALLLPGGDVPGGDFRVFYSAARLLAAGGDPYHLHALMAAEQRAWPSAIVSTDPYAYPSALAILLEPLARLPSLLAYGIFVVLSVSSVSAVIVLFARRLGWRRGGLLAAAALTSWIGFQGLWWGQPDALLLAALLAAVLMAWSGQQLGAGVCMALACLKPDLLWPAAIFMGLALWPDRRATLRFLAGLSGASALLLALGLRLLPAWFHALTVFSSGIQHQSNLAGVAGWVDALPASWHVGTGLSSPLTWLIVLGTLAALGWLGWRVAASPSWAALSRERRILWAVSLALGIWMLATPYAHPNDDLILLPLLVAMVGRDACHAGRPWPTAALLLMATLPIVWNFHPLPVSLTPLAIGALLAAGVATFRRENELQGPLAQAVVIVAPAMPLALRESTPPS